MRPWPGAGRPRKELIAWYQAQSPKARRVLVELLDHPNPRIRLEVAKLTEERAWGKPTQPLEHAGGLDLVQVIKEAYERHMAEKRDTNTGLVGQGEAIAGIDEREDGDGEGD